MSITESQLQTKIKKDLEKEGWLVNKMSLTSLSGWPDLEIYAKGKVKFIECKSLGKTARPLQEHRHKQLRDAGFQVFVLDSWNSYLTHKKTITT